MDTTTSTGQKRWLVVNIVILTSLFVKSSCSIGTDTISEDNIISGNSTIVSSKGLFELGFFQPGPSPNYYIAIWFQRVTSRKPVWVANREKPVSPSSTLKISGRNLALFDKSNTPVWSTNVSFTSRPVRAVLLDNGNLVITDKPSIINPQTYLWQSFDHPSHTWLPGAKLGFNKITKTSQVLTSWKNTEDPSPGLFSHRLDPSEVSINSLWNDSMNYWTTGSWDGHKFRLLPDMIFDYAYTFSFESNENESFFTFAVSNNSATITGLFEMSVSGQMRQSDLIASTHEWDVCSLPPHQCTVYALCGPYGICSEESEASCLCLPGFGPKSEGDWAQKDYSGGCIRRTELSCGIKRDMFLEIPNMSVPEKKQPVESSSSVECEAKCLSDCTCVAFVYDEIGCSIWTRDLVNLKQLQAGDSGRVSLNVRIAASEFYRLKKASQKWKIYVGFAALVATAVLLCGAACVYYSRAKGSAGKIGDEAEKLISDGIESIDVPFIALKIIVAATENFSETNKLGEGGFGPVYKGTFSEGQQIAIKRLSSESGQGAKEFRNEVLLISKLQHRNLVRLLGYCIEGDEKMLLYEYMPNKSLDSFLFHEKSCALLSWQTRFSIILGIARGLLYLHHDSRLRIIHRDLKTSNVLLDEEMNPKISDFGLARSFGGKQLEAKTARVVGTYGYMSPEYALKGLFSIKSDVFAFGVVILEIISGVRNTGSSITDEDLSVLEYAWKLWTENREMDLLDTTLCGNCNVNEFVKCLGVGLLCVQEDPKDRPDMSNVVAMLVSESASLARPNQPAFLLRNSLSRRASNVHDRPISKNHLTNTLIHGR